MPTDSQDSSSSNLKMLTPELAELLKKNDYAEKKPSVPKTVIKTASTDLTNIGFKPAQSNLFNGVSEHGYVYEADNPHGRAFILVDLRPKGNQGKAAIHMYFSSTDEPIEIYLTTYNGIDNINNIKKLQKIIQNINPETSLVSHNLNTLDTLVDTVYNTLII